MRGEAAHRTDGILRWLHETGTVKVPLRLHAVWEALCARETLQDNGVKWLY